MVRRATTEYKNKDTFTEKNIPNISAKNTLMLGNIPPFYGAKTGTGAKVNPTKLKGVYVISGDKGLVINWDRGTG